jgi:hypothetical protein
MSKTAIALKILKNKRGARSPSAPSRTRRCVESSRSRSRAACSASNANASRTARAGVRQLYPSIPRPKLGFAVSQQRVSVNMTRLA